MEVNGSAKREEALSMIAQILRRDDSGKTRTLVTLFDLSVSHFNGVRVAVLALSWE
jgi:hypothetical protein